MRGTWLCSVAIAALAVNAIVASVPFKRLTTQPLRETGRLFDEASLLLLGSSQERRDRLGSVERVTDYPLGHPLRRLAASIGMLDITFAAADGTQRSYLCTAALVAPGLVITNQHCSAHKNHVAIRAALWLEHLDGGSAHIVPVRPAPLEADEALDYALMEIQPAHIATLPKPIVITKTRDAVPGERLFLIHHSRGAPQQISRAFCVAKLDQPSPTQLRHTCPSESGSSGALVFAESDGAIVGLHYAIGTSPDTTRGFATPLTAIIAKSILLRRIN